jgi:outer membrane protein
MNKNFINLKILAIPVIHEDNTMNRRHFFLVLFLLIVTVYSTCLGQDKMVLTLDNSIEYALDHNPEIKIAEKELAKAKAGVWQAYSAVLPQLDASANLQRSWKIQESTIPNFIKTMLGPTAPPDMPDFVRLSFGLKNTFRYGAVVTQPLFLGGAGIAGIQSAKAATRAMEQSYEEKRQNLIYQTVEAFYSCLLNQELIQVQEEALVQAQANLDVVQKKYDVGMASGFDKMRAEVEVANRRPSVISAKNNYQLALTQLRTILGLERSSDIGVSGEFLYIPDDLDNITLEELQNMALKNRPALLALNEQQIIAQKGIALARSNFLPKLFFSTDYSFLAMKNDLKFSQKDFSKGFTSAISLQIPLFNGFRSAAQYQQAKLDHKILMDSEKQANDGIFAEVEISYNKFNESKEKYQSANETVELAQEALRLANLMYQEGTNTQLDVLNSQLALTQARMNYVSSLYEYQTTRYQLRKSTGQLQGVL